MNSKKRCPLNRFKRCREQACACFLSGAEGTGECSFLSLGHLDFTLGGIGNMIFGQGNEQEEKPCKK